MGLLDDLTTPDDTSESHKPDTERAQGGDVGTLKSRANTIEVAGSTLQFAKRGSSVVINGDEIDISEPETAQPDSETGNWLMGQSNAYGIPRGVDAIENRQIVQTSAMQSITNGIVDQLLGGDLAFLDDEDALEDLSESELDAAGRLKTILRDVLTGPHMGDEDLDDLVTAAVEDMLGPGNAYWQLLEPENADLPVVSLTSLDPLTIRHNVNEHGFPMDPPYWQAQGAFSGGGISNIGNVDPVPLQNDQLAVMRYPKGHRSYRRYPVSPAWQVKEWLEILANSTTHHNRFYSDNEIPPGLLQIINASENTVNTVKDKIQEASGDPRDVPIIGGEGGAQWLDMGGTAVNLDVISEQEFFFKMCLGSLGLGKQELGFIEDVNRSNGEVEAERVIKRVAGPFGKQFEEAFLHIARQFPTFRDLGEPFTPTLASTDKRAELAKEERLRKMLQSGAITPRQYARRSGNQDLAEDDERWQVTIDGQTVNYGDHPKWVSERLLSNAGATPPDEPQSESETAEDTES